MTSSPMSMDPDAPVGIPDVSQRLQPLDRPQQPTQKPPPRHSDLLKAVQSTVGVDNLPGIPSRRDLFFATFNIFVCEGAALDSLGDPRYVEVAPKLPPGAEPRAAGTMVHFWSKHLDKNFVKQFKGKFEGLCALPRPVYILARDAHPLGCFVNETVCQSAKLAALFVAMYGRINPAMCNFCTNAFTNPTNAASDPKLSPFDACVSLLGVTSGRCANCYHHQYQGCTPSVSPSNDANPRNPIPELPGPLTSETCPRVIDIYSALNLLPNGQPRPKSRF